MTRLRSLTTWPSFLTIFGLVLLVSALVAWGTNMNIKQEYSEQAAKIDNLDKDNQWHKVDILSRLLEGCGNTVRSKEFHRLIGETGNADPAFDPILAEAFVEYFLKHSDTNSLSKLITKKCPDYVGSAPIEFVLAESSKGMFLLLPSALEKATGDPRLVILKSLGRAFPMIKKGEISDAEFARACREWMGRNPDYVLNPSYPYLPSLPPSVRATSPSASEKALFIPKHVQEGAPN